MIKLITSERGRKIMLKTIKEIISKYENIDFAIEITRNTYTKVEISKKIIIKLWKEK